MLALTIQLFTRLNSNVSMYKVCNIKISREKTEKRISNTPCLHFN